MISSSRERDFQAKQEGDQTTNEGKIIKGSSSSSRQWPGFRNPRIVRVSRSFGGKDRHSKVCTVRGLRDRRIRLSVPTAIQLYDLQDRLGLSQPSKVIDWLLDATKDDIDKLPPLQMPQNFGQFHQSMFVSQEPPSNPSHQSPYFDPNSMFMKDGVSEDHQTNIAKRYWDNTEATMRTKSKEIERETPFLGAEKGKWQINMNNEQENDQDDGNNNNNIGDSRKLFPLTNHSTLPGGLLNNAMALNSYYHWEPSANLSLSQFGNHGFLSQQPENFLNGNISGTNASVPQALPSSFSVPSGHPPQLFFCPTSSTMPASLFPTFPPPYGTNYLGAPAAAGMETSDHSRQMINHFQHVLPSSSMMKPFSLNVNAGLTEHTQNDDDDDDDDEDDDDSRADEENTDS